MASWFGSFSCASAQSSAVRQVGGSFPHATEDFSKASTTVCLIRSPQKFPRSQATQYPAPGLTNAMPAHGLCRDRLAFGVGCGFVEVKRLWASRNSATDFSLAF